MLLFKYCYYSIYSNLLLFRYYKYLNLKILRIWFINLRFMTYQLTYNCKYRVFSSVQQRGLLIYIIYINSAGVNCTALLFAYAIWKVNMWSANIWWAYFKSQCFVNQKDIQYFQPLLSLLLNTTFFYLKCISTFHVIWSYIKVY